MGNVGYIFRLRLPVEVAPEGAAPIEAPPAPVKQRSLPEPEQNGVKAGLHAPLVMVVEQKAATAAEISYMVGFSSPAYFTKCFGDHYGVSPGEVLKRGVAG